MAKRYIGDSNAQMYSNLMPAGTVLPFAGAAAPTGWLLCQGQEISQTTYPELYAVLGSTYNTQTNPTTNAAWATPTAGTFRVPDYRASFLRGVGTPYAGDAVTLGGWQAHKTAKNGLGATTSGSDGAHTHGTGYADTNAATGGFSGLMTSHSAASDNLVGPRTDGGTIIKSVNSPHGHTFIS